MSTMGMTQKVLITIVTAAMLTIATSPTAMSMINNNEEEEMNVDLCAGFWRGRIYGGAFQESDLPVLKRQVQQFKLYPSEGATIQQSIHAIQSIVASGNFHSTSTQARYFLDFANLLERNLSFVEQDRQTKLFMDYTLSGIIRALTY